MGPKFFHFADNRFKNSAQAKAKDYSVWLDAELNAIQSLIGWQRKLYKWLAVPLLVAQYWLVRFGIREADPEYVPLPKGAPKPEPVETPAVAQIQ